MESGVNTRFPVDLQGAKFGLRVKKSKEEPSILDQGAYKCCWCPAKN